MRKFVGFFGLPPCGCRGETTKQTKDSSSQQRTPLRTCLASPYSETYDTYVGRSMDRLGLSSPHMDYVCQLQLKENLLQNEHHCVCVLHSACSMIFVSVRACYGKIFFQHTHELLYAADSRSSQPQSVDSYWALLVVTCTIWVGNLTVGSQGEAEGTASWASPDTWGARPSLMRRPRRRSCQGPRQQPSDAQCRFPPVRWFVFLSFPLMCGAGFAIFDTRACPVWSSPDSTDMDMLDNQRGGP